MKGAGLTSPLDELDGIAVGVSNPSGAQLTIKKIMTGREERCTLGDHGIHRGVWVLGPKNDLDPAPFSFRTKPVVLFDCLDCRNSESESIQREFDMDRFAVRGRAKRLNET